MRLASSRIRLWNDEWSTTFRTMSMPARFTCVWIATIAHRDLDAEGGRSYKRWA